MNVGEILAELYLDLDYEEIPPPAVTHRLKKYVQRAYTAILREPDLSQLRDTATPLAFTSVPGQSIYGMPSQIARVVAITDRTNNRLLTPMSLIDLRLNDPGLTSSGTPWAFVPLGYGQTQTVTRTAAGTGVWVASTSAADITARAQINGVRVSGLPTGDLNAVLTGTTRLQIGSASDVVDLQSVTIDRACVGTVSFFDAATGGTILAQIPAGRLAPSHFRILLYPTNDAATTYYVDGQLQIPELDDEQDVPLLPTDFHTLLIAGALMYEYKRKDDTARFVAISAEAARGLDRLKHFISATATDIPVKGERVTRRFSRFGSWTPADW